MRAKAALRLTLVACCFLLGGANALACPCEPQPVAKAKKRAEAVFAGTVVESYRELSPSGLEWRVRLRIEQSWKGATGDELIVYTFGDCAVSFEAGQKYLVYAQRQEGRGRLITDTCMKTAAFGASADDLNKLGKPKERLPETAEGMKRK